jgi:hypothetical protein
MVIAPLVGSSRRSCSNDSFLALLFILEARQIRLPIAIGRGPNQMSKLKIVRHSRASTTQDAYQRVVPESKQGAMRKLTSFVQASRKVQ